MASELRRWLADRLPADVSSGERLVALEAADNAWEETRVASRKGLLDVMIRRTGYNDAKQLGKVLGKLAARGIELRNPVRGRDGRPVTDKNGRVVYACKGHELELRIPTEEECPALKLPPPGDLQSPPARGTKGSEAPPSGGAKSAKAPPPGPKAPPPGPQSSPQRGTPTPKTTEEKEEEASSAPPVDPKFFGDFWLIYPKSRDKDATREAWDAAIAAGADPHQIIAAAKAYAREKAGQEWRFIKHSANWLRERRYEDDYAPEPNGAPQLRALPGGGWRPFQNPEDHDVYDEDLI